MLNKNKALTNFITGILLSIISIVVFVVLAHTDNSWIGNSTGTKPAVVASWGFGISFVVLLLGYSLFTLIFLEDPNITRVMTAVALSALMMSLIVAFSIAVFDIYLDTGLNIWLFVIVLILILILDLGLVYFIQEYITKFTMAAAAKNRADEWEYSNFLFLVSKGISVEHKNNFTILKNKKLTLKVSFVSEEVIERKLFLDGDTKSKIVSDLENSLSENETGAIVFLSNDLPNTEGVNERITVIKQEKLFSLFKKQKEAKKKVVENE